MTEPNAWGLRRCLTLLAVLALHLALLAALVMESRTRILAAQPAQPLQLVFVLPPTVQRIRTANSPPRRWAAETAMPMGPAMPDLPAAAPAQTASGSGRGSGVDWAAEARRALQAFEIRSHQQPASNESVSTSPGEDDWWPRGPHRAGERYKTANGDWIVWIDSDCYQVASTGQNAGAPQATQPPTICPGDSSKRSEPQRTENP